MTHTLTIDGIPYSIIFVEDELFDDDGELCDGMFDPRQYRIYIKTDLPEVHFKYTILHETLHVLLCRSGVKDYLLEDSNLEEAICSTIAYGLETVDIGKLLSQL
jgi:Zn-dependent peptidase ImmA (M78 family)